MKTRFLALCGVSALLLAGCTNPKKPEISALDTSLPLNQAMDAAIKKDEFMTRTLRPGFHRATDGGFESYAISPNDDGSVTIEHLVVLTKNWCADNGGKVEMFPEIPVLQREIGVVVQQGENLPVVGNAYNMVCYKGEEALAAAAIGRTTYFLSSSQFRKATKEAGASILGMPGRRR